MDAERPEKARIRELWLREAMQFADAFPDDEGPLYLTLGGAGGRDIQLLAENGLVRLTESRAIEDEDKHKIVAVEGSVRAVTRLQTRFPGLRIREAPIQSVVRGTSPFSWPRSGEDDEVFCRARVVNLDLNKPLRATDETGEVIFPVIAWISKIARLHARPPRRDWTLCSTLHGEILWNMDVCTFAQRFLTENFQREPRFANSCRQLLGSELFDRVGRQETLNFAHLSRHAQQQVLMVIVPKLVSHAVNDQGWEIRTARNLRYTGAGGAPMVTWILHFSWDSDLLATPDQAYREALVEIFHSTGSVRPDGSIEATVALSTEDS